MANANLTVIINETGKIVAAAFEDEAANTHGINTSLSPLKGHTVHKIQVPAAIKKIKSVHEFHSSIYHILNGANQQNKSEVKIIPKKAKN